MKIDNRNRRQTFADELKNRSPNIDNGLCVGTSVHLYVRAHVRLLESIKADRQSNKDWRIVCLFSLPPFHKQRSANLQTANWQYVHKRGVYRENRILLLYGVVVLQVMLFILVAGCCSALSVFSLVLWITVLYDFDLYLKGLPVFMQPTY